MDSPWTPYPNGRPGVPASLRMFTKTCSPSACRPDLTQAQNAEAEDAGVPNKLRGCGLIQRSSTALASGDVSELRNALHGAQAEPRIASPADTKLGSPLALSGAVEATAPRAACASLPVLSRTSWRTISACRAMLRDLLKPRCAAKLSVRLQLYVNFAMTLQPRM